MKQNEKISNNKRSLNLIFNIGLCFMIVIYLNACQSNSGQGKPLSNSKENSISKTAVINSQSSIDNYEIAKKKYEESSNDPNALIWFGRRTAYLGNYEEAIKVFTTGIQLHPQDPRMYRHRGHRYISTRQYDKAILDLEKAVTLIKDQKDEIEPDGLPNSRNIPISTLQGNIWYHLGLAYYLKNDMDNALKAFSNRTVTEKYDDNIVSGGHWLYMILARKGKTKEANSVIGKVNINMDIIENYSYHKMCLFYKQLIPESDLKSDDHKSSASNVLTYGLGNWYLYQKQDTSQAKIYYKQLLENGNNYSFAYLAAESDWERIFKNK